MSSNFSPNWIGGHQEGTRKAMCSFLRINPGRYIEYVMAEFMGQRETFSFRPCIASNYYNSCKITALPLYPGRHSIDLIEIEG